MLRALKQALCNPIEPYCIFVRARTAIAVALSFVRAILPWRDSGYRHDAGFCEAGLESPNAIQGIYFMLFHSNGIKANASG